MCRELVGRTSLMSAYLRRLEFRKPLGLYRAELAARRQQPLWPPRSALRRLRPRQTAGIQCRHADLAVRGGGVSMDLARGGDRAADRAGHADQFNSVHERLIDGVAADRCGRARSISPACSTTPRIAARWTISRISRARPAATTTMIDIAQIGAATTTAASSISTIARSNSPSSSIPGNGCSAMHSARACMQRRHAGSSRRGRRSFPTRGSCRCSGTCFRTIPICCRPISRTIQGG